MARRAPLHIPDGSSAYRWWAVDPTGQRQSGQMVASSPEAVVRALARDGWVATRVQEKKTSVADADITAWITGGGVKLKLKARAEFARRLHQMLRAGIAVPKAILSMAEDAKADVAGMYTTIAEKVTGGSTLAAAMAEHPRAFDKVTVAYIASGEEAGTLVQTTERLAKMLANRAAVQTKIKGVTAYPKLVGAAIGLIVTGIILFLVPMYERIYSSFDAELPMPTQWLVWLSNHFIPVSFHRTEILGMTAAYPRPEPLNFLSWVLYLVVGWFVFRRKTKDNPQVGERLDRIKFRAPVLGKLAALQAMQRWASTLAGGLASGVALTRALELAADATGSVWHRNVAPLLVERVRTGRTISSEMLEHTDLYPPSVRTMVATGEATGEVDTMLDSVSASLESDIDALVAGLSAKIEIAMLIVLGVVVGLLLVALYLPVLGLATAATEGMA